MTETIADAAATPNASESLKVAPQADRPHPISWPHRLAVAVLVAVPAVGQSRYGWGDVGHLEEWSTYRRLDQDGPLFWITGDSTYNASMLRPMQLAPASLAYLIDSDSFAGYHPLAAAALALRAWAMYMLACALGSSRQAAAVGGLLFALFPAWQGALTTRLLHFNVAAGAITIAAWLLLRAARRTRPGELIAMGLLTGLGLAIYEAYYPIVVLVPLLLLAIGVSGRRLAALAAAWYVVPVANAVRMAWVWRYGPPQYQEVLVEGSSGASFGDLLRLAARVWSGAAVRLVRPWHGWSLAPLTLIVAAVAVAAAISIAAHDDRLGGHRAAGNSRQRRVRLLLALGLYASFPLIAAVYAGFAVHLRDPQRIFYAVAFPAALAFAVLLDLVPRRTARAGIGAMVAAAVVVGAFAQRRHWHDVSTFQARTLGAVATAYSEHGAPPELVLLDPTGHTGGIFTLHPGFVEIDLRYLFQRSDISVTVCHADAAERPSLPVGDPCWSDSHEIALDDGRLVPTAKVLTLQLSRGGVEYVDGPTGPVLTVPDRVRAALDCVSDSSCAPLPSPDGLEAPGLE